MSWRHETSCRFFAIAVLCCLVLSIGATYDEQSNALGTSAHPEAVSDMAALRVDLGAISCVSASYCLAVGNPGYGSSGDPAVIQWNGHQWSDVGLPPSPAGYTTSGFLAVSCFKASDCLVEGNGSDGAPRARYDTFASQWDGSDWSDVFSTDTPAAFSASSFACPSQTFCMTVGDYITHENRSVGHPYAIEWHGGKLSTTPVPGRTYAALQAVSCPRPSFCMAVGGGEHLGVQRDLAYRWNGRSWTATHPSIGMTSVACAGSRCWASDVHVIQFWNGESWETQKTAGGLSKNHNLLALSCVRDFCMVVGNQSNGANGSIRPAAEDRDKGGWHFRPIPGVSGSNLFAVSCVGPSFCMAVGATGSDQAYTVRWNGKVWQTAPVRALVAQ